MTIADNDTLLTAQEAAEYLGCRPHLVYQRRHAGYGPVSFKRNNRVVFRKGDIDSWLEQERLRTLRGEGV